MPRTSELFIQATLMYGTRQNNYNSPTRYHHKTMKSIPALVKAAASCRAAMADPTKAKTILITGRNSGIGLATVKILRVTNPRRRLILVARNEAKAKESCEAVSEAAKEEGG